MRRAALALALIGGLAALLYAKAIPCAFASLFHAPCPGCGSTRSVVALLQGDLDGVVRFNPLGPVLAVLIVAIASQSFASVLAHGDLRGAGEGRLGWVVKRGVFLVAGLELLLWIARFLGAFGGPVPV